MHTRVRGSSTACPHSTNDSTQCPSRFYYRDVLLFIHHGPLGDAGWQEAEVAPALPSPQPSVKTNAAPHPPSFIPPFFLSLLSFCFPPAHGLCQRRTKVEQALFSSSGRLVVLAFKVLVATPSGSKDEGFSPCHPKSKPICCSLSPMVSFSQSLLPFWVITDGIPPMAI